MAQDDTAPEKKTLDLSVAQIAGSSLATVAAALLASKLGVYGTILGAGVVSVVATAGGPVIQHVFRRTGDRLRGDGRFESPHPRPRRSRSPRPQSTHPPSDRPTAAAETEYGEATVHGTRVRGWKRTAVASGAAFAMAIGGLGAYEAAAGTSISDGGGTLLSGGTRKAADHRRPDPPGSRKDKGGTGKDENGRGGADKGGGASPDPARSPGGESPTPDPTPSRSADPTPTPSPSTPPPKTTPSPTPPPTPPTATAAPSSP